MRCVATTSAGSQCKLDATSTLPLCHVHDPNGEWMRQRPRLRKEWLERPDIAAIMEGRAVRALHCGSCTCVRPAKAGETPVSNVELLSSSFS